MGASRAALPARLRFNRCDERGSHRTPDVSKGGSAALGQAKPEKPCVRRLLQSAPPQLGSEVACATFDALRNWCPTGAPRPRLDSHRCQELNSQCAAEDDDEGDGEVGEVDVAVGFGADGEASEAPQPGVGA